jgi:serine/threonine protein kinase
MRLALLGRVMGARGRAARGRVRGERRKRLEREARAAASLSHPGIVTLHALEANDGESFLAMELVSGEPLAKLIEKGPLEVELLLDLAIAIADAMAAAHEQRVTHRISSPSTSS